MAELALNGQCNTTRCCVRNTIVMNTHDFYFTMRSVGKDKTVLMRQLQWFTSLLCWTKRVYIYITLLPYCAPLYTGLLHYPIGLLHCKLCLVCYSITWVVCSFVHCATPLPDLPAPLYTGLLQYPSDLLLCAICYSITRMVCSFIHCDTPLPE